MYQLYQDLLASSLIQSPLRAALVHEFRSGNDLIYPALPSKVFLFLRFISYSSNSFSASSNQSLNQKLVDHHKFMSKMLKPSLD